LGDVYTYVRTPFTNVDCAKIAYFDTNVFDNLLKETGQVTGRGEGWPRRTVAEDHKRREMEIGASRDLRGFL
jgi:hypothetical protein